MRSATYKLLRQQSGKVGTSRHPSPSEPPLPSFSTATCWTTCTLAMASPAQRRSSSERGLRFNDSTGGRGQFGSLHLEKITPGAIITARKTLKASPTFGSGHLKPKNLSNATLNRYMAALSHLMKRAVEWELTSINPCSKVGKLSEGEGRTRVLSDEELPRLITAARADENPHIYLWLLSCLCTGGRQSEILNLTWSNVDFERRVIRFLQTKNHTPRTVPLIEPLLSRMQERKQSQTLCSVLVFPSKRNPSMPTDIRTAWERILTKANLADLRPHDLRHCCASYLTMAGASTLEVAAVLGHKTLQMTKRYTHLAPNHLANVVAPLRRKLEECD